MSENDEDLDGASLSTSKDVTIGRSDLIADLSGHYARRFDGKIDEVRICSRMLTAEEIRLLAVRFTVNGNTCHP